MPPKNKAIKTRVRRESFIDFMTYPYNVEIPFQLLGALSAI
jgi:hypothetical protein